MASNLDCICTDTFGCEKHSFYKEAIKKTYFFLLKNWIEKISVLSAVSCSCVSLFDVAFENDL